jgi:ketosteroid isomerase-like protein
MRQDTATVIDAYLRAFAAKDLSAAPLHPEIEFESPLSPPLKGATALRQVFAGFFPTVKGIRVVRHIVDGEWCATLFNMETTFGTIPMLDVFHVVDGQIRSIRVYYDPRTILEGMSRVA